MLLNLTPNLYFRQTLRKIRAHELDAALVQLPFDYVLEALRSFSFSFLFHVLEVLGSFFLLFFPPTTYSRRCGLMYVSSCYACPHTTIHYYILLYARYMHELDAAPVQLPFDCVHEALPSFFLSFFCVSAPVCVCVCVMIPLPLLPLHTLYTTTTSTFILSMCPIPLLLVL